MQTMARLPVCVLVLVCTSRLADAQHARYPRQQPTPVPPALSERVQPIVIKAPSPAAAKPSIDADSVLSIEGLRSPARTEHEQILADLIASTPDSDVEEKSDYYFRLGELYAKQQRYWRMKSVELTDKTQAAKAAEQAKLYLLKAVKTFKGLTDTDTFRNYPKLDVALFYYAYTLQGGKYMKEARQVYDKLLKNYPQSKYVPEAHVAFADYYYDSGQLADAETRYKHVLKFPKASVYGYALYKLGWIDVQLSRPQDAVEHFYKAASATRGDANLASLHRAATADFARTHAGIDKTQFDVQKLDKSAATELSELFADIARERGDANRAVAAYRELLARARGDARSCRWQYRIAHATLTMAGATNALKLKEIDALVRIYTAQKQPDEECRANAAAMSGELAAAYHADWSKTQNADALDFAEQLYAMHAVAFPDAAGPRAAYAEVLWTRADRESNAKLRSERWRRAAETFATIQTSEAARATALAWMNAQDIVTPTETAIALGKPPRARPRGLPLKGADAKVVAAVKAYTKHAPAIDEDLAQMRLAAATILRRQRHFEAASTMLDEFLADHGQHARAELAANLMLASIVQAGMLDEARKVAEAIAADATFVEGKQSLQRNIQILRLMR